MFIRIEGAALLTLAALATGGGGAPTFNIEQHCRAVARMAAPVGDPQPCIRAERRARAALIRQWQGFHPSDRAECLHRATLGPDPTYTHLLTCLELERDARLAHTRR